MVPAAVCVLCVHATWLQLSCKPRSDNARLQCSLIPCTSGCCRSKGLIKRVPLKQFASINRLGLAAMGVKVCQAGLWGKLLHGLHGLAEVPLRQACCWWQVFQRRPLLVMVRPLLLRCV